MVKPIGMAEMKAIFEVTDDLGISREKVSVPLAPSGDGAVRRLPDGAAEIVVPEGGATPEWAERLRQELLDLGFGS